MRSVLMVAVLMALGCSKTRGPNTNSETHFLGECESDCAQGFECVCGVCTTSCDQASSCPGGYLNAACVQPEALGSSESCAAPAAPRVCNVTCSANNECTSLGDGYRCINGSCRLPQVQVPGCTYEGRAYAKGETFPAGDGCNACSCASDGAVQCTTVACNANPLTCYDETSASVTGPAPTGLPAMPLPAANLTIDMQACSAGYWSASLPFGSAWVAVQPSGAYCEIWLGGETENPNYNGAATQTCRFLRSACELTLFVPSSGGPIATNSPACTPSASEQACPAGTKFGVACAECGPADECVRKEQGCRTTCATNAQCGGSDHCNIADGYCITPCG